MSNYFAKAAWFFVVTVCIICIYALFSAVIALGINEARVEFANLLNGRGLKEATIQAMSALSAPSALGVVLIAVYENIRKKRLAEIERVNTITSMFTANMYGLVVSYDSVIKNMEKRGEHTSTVLMPGQLITRFTENFVDIRKVEALFFSEVAVLPKKTAGTIILIFGAIQKTQYLFNVRCQATDLTCAEFYSELKNLRKVTVTSTFDLIGETENKDWQAQFGDGSQISPAAFRDEVTRHIKNEAN